jgi:hypothetical protein
MENQTIDKIIEKLKNYGIAAEWYYIPNAIWKEIDGEFEVKLNERTLTFPIEIKKELKKQNLVQLDLYKEIFPDLIVAADTIYPEVRKILKEKEINYVDVAGNMFLKTPDNFIFIEGNRREEPLNKYKGRLFGKGGTKIIFVLLLDENLLNAPYRDIAKVADTGLGTVTYIMKELDLRGYIININENEKKLKNKKDLMNKWITGYEDKLKKTLFLGKFRFNKNDWKNLKFENNKTLWGGEPAADVLTHYLHPQLYTIYTNEETKDLIKKYYLIPDANGNIEVYKKFWNFKDETLNEKTVPQLLIYADLINTGDNRNLETAKLIYERYLQDKFE